MSSPNGQSSSPKEEEGDNTASLKVEATEVKIEPVPGLVSDQEFDLASFSEKMCERGVEKYKEAFALLWPDGQGFVHKSKLLQFFQSVLGPLYSDEMANCLVDIMEPDENGNISLESFVQAFSLSYWTPESVAAMHEVLAANPDLVNKLADWKNILGRLGMDMNDQEVASIIEQAQKGAAALLDKELAKSKDHIPNREEVNKKSTEILDAIKQKIHLMDLGGANASKVSSAGEANCMKSLHLEEPSEEEKLKDEGAPTQPEEHPVELNK
ncbi:uncharacterized protein LOC106666254 [Cimex lectularius]|uniref:Calmodulin n=1 Tax=Cimex lectularius TaxID=79782 RepID=A0A8I6RVJ4_CIMLE|nr:uncharacterized protein LOC106666254 [Cimex lectularius]